jgi:hypothetical protein
MRGVVDQRERARPRSFEIITIGRLRLYARDGYSANLHEKSPA